MDLKYLVSLAYVTVVLSVKTPPTSDYYMAAVVEYHPTIGKDGNETLFNNTERYVSIISQAAKYADIVVFPEAGLQFQDSTMFLEIPLTENSSNSSHVLQAAVQSLSNAAKNNSIYVVVNLHEEYKSVNKTYRYNTNVVFDRHGDIIARYRKYNLFSEKSRLNITESPEHITFETDFGVTFGTFTCFDIIFEDPPLKLNATDYVFTTWWFSELPFLTAVQEQAAWSYGTDANLLAAGGNNVALGSSGSGIYAGRKGPLVYTQSSRNETTLLTAKVFKKLRLAGQSEVKVLNIQAETEKKSSLKMKTDSSMRLYKSESIAPLFTESKVKRVQDSKNSSLFNLTQDFILEKEICQGDFCCYYSVNVTFVYNDMKNINVTEFTLKDDNFNQYQYRIATFNGVRTFDGVATGGLQVCSIMSCLDSNLSSCGKNTSGAPLHSVNSTLYGQVFLYTTKFNSVIIKTASLEHGVFAEPSLLESSNDSNQFGSLMNVTNFSFKHVHGTSEAELRFTSERLGNAAIFARQFSRDGKQVGISPAASKDFKVSLIIGSVLFIFCWRMFYG